MQSNFTFDPPATDDKFDPSFRHEYEAEITTAEQAQRLGENSTIDNSNYRPVSTTKRAKQNRNAQRAFRQRKEKYIKELELKAQESDQLRQTIEELKLENQQLRDYTLALQSKLIEISPSSQVNEIPKKFKPSK